MAQKSRIYCSESQEALMLERWRKGESLQQIAQLFDPNHSSIQRILAETVSIRPAQPCQLALTLAEREDSRAVATAYSLRYRSAMQLGRVPSTSWQRCSVAIFLLSFTIRYHLLFTTRIQITNHQSQAPTLMI